MRKGRFSTLSQLGAIEGEPGKRYEGRPIHSAGSAATTELYARYKAEQGIKVHARATAWGAAKNRKDKAVEAAKRTGRLKRAAIKMLSGPGVNKNSYTPWSASPSCRDPESQYPVPDRAAIYSRRVFKKSMG